jgi:hypothetical protein
MGDVNARHVGSDRRRTSLTAQYEAQEPGDREKPEIERPPRHGPDTGNERPEEPYDDPSSPFTGEDVEDAGRPAAPRQTPEQVN